MKFSKLQNFNLKHRSEGNRSAYKKQRNFCFTLLKKNNTDFFNSSRPFKKFMLK